MFKVYRATLDQNITYNPANSPLDKQGRNCRQLHCPFLLPLVEIAGSECICTARDQWSGWRSGLCRCLEPAEYRGWGDLLQTASLSTTPCSGQFSSINTFYATKILLIVKRQLCMGHIQVVEGHLVLSTD